MGVLRRLFGGASDTPSEWTELWELLRPLGSSLTVSTAADWVDRQRETNPRQLARALRQLKRAYVLLDTEDHGRAVRDHPFTALGEPFARRRFVRVVDRVILAGPEAVERVVAEPVRIRAFDTVPLLTPEESHADPQASEMSLFLAMVQASTIVGTQDEFDPEEVWDMLEWSAGWPSMADRSPAETMRQELALDPEVPWLEISTYHLDATELTSEEIDALDDDELERYETEEGEWAAPARTATVRLFSALGHTPLEDDAGLPEHLVVVVSRVSAPAADAHVEIALTDPELALGTEAQRADQLARRVARVLLDQPLPWSTRSREALSALADDA